MLTASVSAHPELKLLRARESVFSLPTLEAWSLDAKLLPSDELYELMAIKFVD